MSDDEVEAMVRGAIGGDADAIDWLVARGDTVEDPIVIAMAALLERQPDRLDRAVALAATSRDRQMIAIARSHLRDEAELVDALARDHLADFPDSLIVAWIASAATWEPTTELR